ncbi:MAG: lipopolysaccharide kinase InaA family protein [Patescibacteria group bacterium]
MRGSREIMPERSPDEPIEHLLETCLLEGVKTDEGNKGIILELAIDKLPAGWQEQLLGEEENAQSGQLAAKVIKIFLPGKIEHEAHMQRRAHDIIADQADQSAYAKVPHAYCHKEITVHDPSLLSKLKTWGVTAVGDRVGFMVMDFVQGEDLATHLYKHIIQHDHRLRDLKQRMGRGERLTFNDIRDRVQVAMGFERPPAQAGQVAEFIFEAANLDRLMVALKKYDFHLEQHILDKLQNTIRLLHDNNIYHNDLHERNIILKLDESGQIVDVYLVDFDRALDMEDISVAGRDSDVLTRYRSFTNARDREQESAEEKWLLSMQRLKERFANSKSEKMRSMWREFEGEIRKLLELDSPNRIKLLADEIFVRTYHLTQSDEWCRLAGAVVLDIDKLEKERAVSRVENRRIPSLAKSLVQNLINRESSPYTYNFWEKLWQQLDGN